MTAAELSNERVSCQSVLLAYSSWFAFIKPVWTWTGAELRYNCFPLSGPQEPNYRCESALSMHSYSCECLHFVMFPMWTQHRPHAALLGVTKATFPLHRTAQLYSTLFAPSSFFNPYLSAVEIKISLTRETWSRQQHKKSQTTITNIKHRQYAYIWWSLSKHYNSYVQWQESTESFATVLLKALEWSRETSYGFFFQVSRAEHEKAFLPTSVWALRTTRRHLVISDYNYSQIFEQSKSKWTKGVYPKWL